MRQQQLTEANWPAADQTANKLSPEWKFLDMESRAFSAIAFLRPRPNTDIHSQRGYQQPALQEVGGHGILGWKRHLKKGLGTPEVCCPWERCYQRFPSRSWMPQPYLSPPSRPVGSSTESARHSLLARLPRDYALAQKGLVCFATPAKKSIVDYFV